MRLRFFADHCVPNFIIKSLKDLGYEVFQLKEYLLTDSPDHLVIEKAQELNSILLSLNADFTNIINYPPANYKGIIALQIRNRPETISIIMERLKNFLLVNSDMAYFNGKLIIVESHRIRIKE